MQGFFWPYFPMFELNMKIYSIKLCIQSKYGKAWMKKKTPYLNTIYAVRSLLNNWWFITLLISRLLCNNDVVYAVLTCCMCFISGQAFSNLEKEKEYIILLNNNKTHWNCFITCGSFWSINIQDYSSRFNPSIDIAKKIS